MLLRLLSCTLLLASSRASGAIPYTIGNAVMSSVVNSTFDPVVVFEHTLSDSAAYGVMSHWWSTGEANNDELVLDYWIDGEKSPSVSFQLGMAAGQGWPRMKGDIGGGEMGQHKKDIEPWAPLGFYTAGGKMGKQGIAGGYHGYHNILFQKSIRITARTLGDQQSAQFQVRGHEVDKASPAAAGHVLPSGFQLPPNARMQLQRIDNVRYERLQFVPIVNLPKGYAGVMQLVTLAPETSPAGNAYIEGCWHLYTDSKKEWPGVIMGTGTEDFFDSSYYWGALGGPDNVALLYAHDNSGLTHFSRVFPNGTDAMQLPRPMPKDTIERFSAYRFFDNEVIGFRDGGALHWRVGDDASKCTGCPDGEYAHGVPCRTAYGEANPTKVRSYAWLYTWPLDESKGPAPSQEPIQCPHPAKCGPRFPKGAPSSEAAAALDTALAVVDPHGTTRLFSDRSAVQSSSVFTLSNAGMLALGIACIAGLSISARRGSRTAVFHPEGATEEDAELMLATWRTEKDDLPLMAA